MDTTSNASHIDTFIDRINIAASKNRPLFNVINVNDCKCVLISAKHFGTNSREIHKKIYAFWFNIWTDTFAEIGQSFENPATEFCRHEYVIAVLNQEQIISCLLIDRFDLENIVHTTHKYFNTFPNDAIKVLTMRSQGSPAMTVGYLTVHKDFRGTAGLTDLTLGLALKHFQLSTSKVLISYTRNTRKTNELTLRLGAHPILKNVTVHGEPSDFIYFDDQSLESLKSHPLFYTIENFWINKKEFNISDKQQQIEGTKNEKFNLESSL